MTVPLLSVQSVSEVALLQPFFGGLPFILDVKDPEAGTLGAPRPHVLAGIAARVGGRCPLSIALGDLGYQPGTAALAAQAALTYKPSYLKVGLNLPGPARMATEVLAAVQEVLTEQGAETLLVAAGYGDYRRQGTLSPSGMIEAAVAGGATIVLLDAFSKQGETLFDHLPPSELAQVISEAHAAGLGIGLAGALGPSEVPALLEIEPDFLGFRGCLTCGHRSDTLDPQRVRALLHCFDGR